MFNIYPQSYFLLFHSRQSLLVLNLAYLICKPFLSDFCYLIVGFTSLPQVQQSLSVTCPLWFTLDLTLKQSFVDLLWPCQSLQSSGSSNRLTTGPALLLYRTPAGRDTLADRSSLVDVVRVKFNIRHSVIKWGCALRLPLSSSFLVQPSLDGLLTKTYYYYYYYYCDPAKWIITRQWYSHICVALSNPNQG